MKSFFKNNFSLIILAVIAAVFAVIACFSVVNFSAPSSYYKTDKVGENDAVYFNAAVYKLEYPENVKLSSVWINLGSKDYKFTPSDGQKNEITVSLGLAGSESGSFFKINSYTFPNTVAGVREGEWQILCDDVSVYSSYKFISVHTKNQVKINEIAFVGADAEGSNVLLKAESIGSGAKKNYNYSLSRSTEFDISDGAKIAANKLIDEQNKFNIKKITENGYVALESKFTLNESEYYFADTVKNIISDDGSYIDLSSNPLGYYIVAIGAEIFGYNAFGLRIMPLLFTLGTIVLVYFLGVLLFSNRTAGLVFSFLYAVGGYSLFFATTCGADSIFVFFALLAFYSMVKFYKRGVGNKNRASGLINILLGGLAFSAALATKTQALYLLFPLFLVFGFGLVRQYHAYAKRALACDSEQASRKNKADYVNRALITAVAECVGFILLPFIIVSFSYIFVGGAYGEFFGEKGFLDYMTLSLSRSLKFKPSGEFTGFAATGFFNGLINYDAAKVGAGKFVFGNVFVVWVSLLCALFSVIYSVLLIIGAKKNPIPEKDFHRFIMPTLFLLTTVAFTVVMPSLFGVISVGGYYITSVFISGAVASLYNYFDGENRKPLFNACGISFTLTNVVAIALALITAVVFALAVPAFIGTAVSTSAFAFNTVRKAVFG